MSDMHRIDASPSRRAFVTTALTAAGVILPGTPGATTAASRLMPKVDLILAGEWEGIYYAHDTVVSGQAKAMVTLGHAIWEDRGMKLCADWLKTFISDLPVEWIPAGEPFSGR